MPHHAIAAGCADRILSPEDIAHALARLSSHPYVAHQQPTATPRMPAEEEQSFSSILLLLRNQTGVDFPSYKPATLKRRIYHRMAVLHLKRMTDYATYLDEHSSEVEALYQDVLIQVTSFFRDPAAFEAMTRLVFPEIVQHLAPGESIRIWVPGCSTGEEAYSLAICLREFLEERSLTLPIQLFATDINPRAVAQARAGIYPAASLSALSPERLERFFTPIDRTRELYQISKAIRERCVFVLHNVAKDPPFPRLDLVSCRNVLMYLRSPLQRRVLQMFHYALKPHGFLLLGLSESADSLSRLFACLDKRQKVYAKKADGGVLPLSLMVSGETPAASHPREGERPMPEETRKEFDLQQEADHVLLTNYAPASVVIDRDMEILYVRGHTSPYLEIASGRASFNLLKMVRDDLALGLRSVIHTASKQHHPVTKGT
jgi:two-component system, chemotaxis family, CheB/CheR fusion protein